MHHYSIRMIWESYHSPSHWKNSFLSHKSSPHILICSSHQWCDQLSLIFFLRWLGVSVSLVNYSIYRFGFLSFFWKISFGLSRGFLFRYPLLHGWWKSRLYLFTNRRCFGARHEKLYHILKLCSQHDDLWFSFSHLFSSSILATRRTCLVLCIQEEEWATARLRNSWDWGVAGMLRQEIRIKRLKLLWWSPFMRNLATGLFFLNCRLIPPVCLHIIASKCFLWCESELGDPVDLIFSSYMIIGCNCVRDWLGMIS